MRLLEVRINGFRSVKEPLRLHIDPAVSILIGANDHGKTNLLEAIRSLNDDRSFTVEDENWDLVGQNKLSIEYDFQLDPDESEWIKTNAPLLSRKATPETGVSSEPKSKIPDPPPATDSGGATAAPVGPAAAVPAAPTPTTPEPPAEPKPREEQSAAAAEPTVEDFQIPTRVTFSRKGITGALDLILDDPLGNIPGVKEELLKMRPRVELFASVEQLMDVVTLEQLEDPKQEFMQGIFRYGDIWDVRKTLFKQDPATAKRLEQASEDFTRRIRDEWKQGEHLTFKFQHAGQQGNHIELLIRDPSVKDRFVRPSERSEGFSAFFKLNMRLLARQLSHPAHEFMFLFDEPGTALHPSGQVNLQRVFERLSRGTQIIYATHSLFMINHNRPERNRVVSKDDGGTKVDQKPYLRNWRAVRDSLGLILAGNFFIADTTLLLEGESDALYVGALLAALDRAGIIDIDLNLFSVQWAGNSRDFEPMARLMLEEGRLVVAMVDGDRSGTDLNRKIERLNDAVKSKRVPARAPVTLIQLDRNCSIEDILPCRDKYLSGVITAAEELVTHAFREIPDTATLNREVLLGQLNADKGSLTLGKHVENVTATWFKVREPISKLTISRHYCGWLEGIRLKEEGVNECPAALAKLIDALKLGSKLSEDSLFEKAKA